MYISAYTYIRILETCEILPTTYKYPLFRVHKAFALRRTYSTIPNVYQSWHGREGINGQRTTSLPVSPVDLSSRVLSRPVSIFFLLPQRPGRFAACGPPSDFYAIDYRRKRFSNDFSTAVVGSIWKSSREPQRVTQEAIWLAVKLDANERLSVNLSTSVALDRHVERSLCRCKLLFWVRNPYIIANTIETGACRCAADETRLKWDTHENARICVSRYATVRNAEGKKVEGQCIARVYRPRGSSSAFPSRWLAATTPHTRPDTCRIINIFTGVDSNVTTALQ